MAKTNAVWGIDIGDCALKAMRCRMSSDGSAIEADAFDYIEYPKILTQPEANAEQLVKEALEQFLSRNPTKGDKVAISVGGQSGLARFIKLPPVESKKIPDLVKFEARQQIPFPLDEVIWDFQQLPGGSVEEGFTLETEVGLFAMKKEQVQQEIAPFQKAGIELDIVQLTPLSIYNFVSYDVLPEVEDFDPQNPPESVVVVSMGTETTDLVITNGYRVWQRSVPIGGNHFTKQLTKELKLTFAKAEHLKRNIRAAENPKAVITAMSPVFKDLVGELQRSIGFFRNNDRRAKISRVLVMGNAAKLPSFSQFLSSKLEMEVQVLDKFERLVGDDVVTSPAFQDNTLSFAVCYGLATQGLSKSRLSTNLIPQEILIDRLVKEKKPWAVAALSALMLAFMLGIMFQYSRARTVAPEYADANNITWAAASSDISSVSNLSSGHISKDNANKSKIEQIRNIGEEVIGNSDGRLLWIELLRTINSALPQNQQLGLGEIPDPNAKPFNTQKRIFVEHVESQYFPELENWFTEAMKARYIGSQVAKSLGPEPAPEAAAAEGEAAEGEAAEGEAATPEPQPQPAPEPGEEEITGPTGPGWVIELKGYHFYNLPLTPTKAPGQPSRGEEGGAHVRATLIKNLENGFVMLPAGPGKPLVKFTMKEMGISFPTMVDQQPIQRDHTVKKPGAADAMQDFGGAENEGIYGDEGAFGAGSGPAKKKTGDEEEEKVVEKTVFVAPKFEFTIQFCWQEQRLSERLEVKRQQAEEEAKKAEEEAAAAAAEPAAEQPDGNEGQPAEQPNPNEGQAAPNGNEGQPAEQPNPNDGQAAPNANEGQPAEQPNGNAGQPGEQQPAAKQPPGPAAPPVGAPPTEIPPAEDILTPPPGVAPAAPAGEQPNDGPAGAAPAKPPAN